MPSPTVAVVGTGRSGTSFVAQILHQKLNVCMGHYLRQGNVANPNGFFEDLFSAGLIELLLKNAIGIEEYLSSLEEYHKDCPQWGFKDPKFVELPLGAMLQVNPKLIIRTWRPLEATVHSWQNKDFLLHGIKPTEERAEQYRQLTLNRETLMDTKLKYFTVLTVRMENRVSEEELIAPLKDMLCQ